MGKLHKRFEKAATWENLVTLTIRKKLDEVVFKSRMCKITFTVWDTTGVPCKHVTACISHRRMNIETFCDQAYQRHKFLGAYEDIIHPIHDETSDSRRLCTVKCAICKEIGHNKRTWQTSGVEISQESGRGSSLGKGVFIKGSDPGCSCTSSSGGAGSGIPTGRDASGRGSISTAVGGQHDGGQPRVQPSKWNGWKLCIMPFEMEQEMN
ncbi:hypothetical protein CsSME_00046317 [Camellia sinensis var. sinensis]